MSEERRLWVTNAGLDEQRSELLRLLQRTFHDTLRNGAVGQKRPHEDAVDQTACAFLYTAVDSVLGNSWRGATEPGRLAVVDGRRGSALHSTSYRRSQGAIDDVIVFRPLMLRGLDADLRNIESGKQPIGKRAILAVQRDQTV